jgi:hypothetical protein
MEDKIIATAPGVFLSLFFTGSGIWHLLRSSETGGIVNAIIGVAFLAVIPFYVMRARRDWLAGLG